MSEECKEAYHEFPVITSNHWICRKCEKVFSSNELIQYMSVLIGELRVSEGKLTKKNEALQVSNKNLNTVCDDLEGIIDTGNLKIKALEEDHGLLILSHDSRKKLLESCENALQERDTQVLKLLRDKEAAEARVSELENKILRRGEWVNLALDYLEKLATSDDTFNKNTNYLHIAIKNLMQSQLIDIPTPEGKQHD